MYNNCPCCGVRFTYEGFAGGECPTKGCTNYKPQVIVVTAKPIIAAGKYDCSRASWEQLYQYQQDVSNLLWYTNCDDPRTQKFWHNTSSFSSGMSKLEYIEYYNTTLGPAVLGPPSASGLTVTRAQLIGMGMLGMYFRSEQEKKIASDWFSGWLGSRNYASYKKP